MNSTDPPFLCLWLPHEPIEHMRPIPMPEDPIVAAALVKFYFSMAAGLELFGRVSSSIGLRVLPGGER